ncbi:MAG: hypothetical protein HPY74_07050 [Firmicutes bacterium]|nr:hypothetical protein [Bacillota bacterium]
MHLIPDKGFYSKKNVDELLAARDKFTIAVSIRNKWVQEVIDEIRDDIYGPDGYRKLDGEILYVYTRLHWWGKENRRCYLHLYYNAHLAAESFDGFTEELLNYKEELETGNIVKEHEDAHKTFFTIKETPVRGIKVSYNADILNGFSYHFIIIILNNSRQVVQ